MRATTMRVVNGYRSAMRGQQVSRQKGGHITRHAPVVGDAPLTETVYYASWASHSSNSLAGSIGGAAAVVAVKPARPRRRTVTLFGGGRGF